MWLTPDSFSYFMIVIKKQGKLPYNEARKLYWNEYTKWHATLDPKIKAYGGQGTLKPVWVEVSPKK